MLELDGMLRSQLRRITDAIPQTIVVQDPAGTPLYANHATLDYTGLAMEDVVAKPGFRERKPQARAPAC